VGSFALLFALSTAPAIFVEEGPQSAFAADADHDKVVAMLDKFDDAQRGQRSISTAEMIVKTSRYERTMKMKTWTEGQDKTLIRIEAPAKDAGNATLKVGDNLWNYLFKVDRVMKLPAGMMSGSWNGSHMTNDDLVRETRMSRDYTFEVLERPSGDSGKWVISLVPNENVPVVWGKVVITLSAKELAEKVEYYDDRGNIARTMTLSDYVRVGSQDVPKEMRVVPGDKPNEYTLFRTVEIEFDVNIDSSTFSQQALRAR